MSMACFFLAALITLFIDEYTRVAWALLTSAIRAQVLWKRRWLNRHYDSRLDNADGRRRLPALPLHRPSGILRHRLRGRRRENKMGRKSRKTETSKGPG